MTNWTELKRLAEEAGGDEWFQHGGIDAVLNHNCESVCETGEDDPVYARFIAAANPKTILALTAENERLNSDRNELSREYLGIARKHDDIHAERNELRAEVEALRNSLRQISNEVDCNMRPLIRDLVNRACGLDNGANPNDLYEDCDRIDEIIDSALDSNQ